MKLLFYAGFHWKAGKSAGTSINDSYLVSYDSYDSYHTQSTYILYLLKYLPYVHWHIYVLVDSPNPTIVQPTILAQQNCMHARTTTTTLMSLILI